MPGYAFHVETLKKANPSLLAANPQACALGAMGPDLFRHLPPSQALVTALRPGGLLTGANLTLLQAALQDLTSLTAAQKAALLALAPQAAPLLLEFWAKPYATAYALLLGPTGLDVATTWPLLSQVSQLLATIDSIVGSENEFALAGQISNVTGLSSTLSGLSSLGSNLQGLMTTATFIPALGPWMQEPALGAFGFVDPKLSLPGQDDPAGCRLWEFLRWHLSGEFAYNLSELARTPSQQAFAQGWLCHVAASVAAEPFVANITGGPYRTHWWRNMLVRNYVDSWIYGFVQSTAGMSGDTPTPPYPTWSALTSANLQEAFNVGGALSTPSPAAGVPAAVTALASGDLGTLLGTLPSEIQEISDLFDEALAATYGPAELVKIGATALPKVGAEFSAGVLKSAYIGAFAVYWFMTSGTGPLNNNLLGSPPAGCGTTAPTWITTGQTPSLTTAGLTSGGAACAVILAILSLFSLLTGDVPGALAALAGAMASTVVNWTTVACNLYWATNALYKEENALRDALVFLALAYPPPVLLGGEGPDGTVVPASDLSPVPNLQELSTAGDTTPVQGVPLTRSNRLRPGQDPDDYPAAMDLTTQGLADLDWLAYPAPAPPPTLGATGPDVPTETDATNDLIPDSVYADSVFSAPLANGGILAIGGPFPSRVVAIGGAVANAVLVLGGAGKLADFNLDADRGYGWLGWHPQSGSDPTTDHVTAVADS